MTPEQLALAREIATKWKDEPSIIGGIGLVFEALIERGDDLEVERDMLRREIVAIEDAFAVDTCPLEHADDIEHYIRCHVDTLPKVARDLAIALTRVRDAGRERHEKEDPG